MKSDSLRLLESLGPLPEPTAEPFLIAVSGLPGTGKSYLCRELLKTLPAVIVESDAIRKTIFRSPAYSFRESNYLFRTIHSIIEELLSRGISVILDATNLTEKNRGYLHTIADRLEVKLILVKVTAPPAVVRKRLEERKKGRLNKSDADLAVYEKMLLTAEEIRRKHFTVNTAQDISAAVAKIVREAMSKSEKRSAV